MRTGHKTMATLAIVLLLAAAATVTAHTVLFKDGFILYGRVSQQGSIQMDPGSGQPFWLGRGSYYLDTVVRRILFSHSRVQDVDEHDPVQEGEVLRLANRVSHANSHPPLPVTKIIDITRWDDKWERTITLRVTINGFTQNTRIKQRLVVLTPQYARVESQNFAWAELYLTKELGASTVGDLLTTFPDLKLKGNGDTGDIDKRFRRYRFLAQAGWYDAAGEELASLLKEFPGEKEKVDTAEADLRKLRALAHIEQIQRAHQAGRHHWAQQQLASFSAPGIDDKLQARLRSLKADYETANTNLALAKRLLKQLPQRTEPSQRRLFVNAAAIIRDELIFENIGRLEPFLVLAQQAERDELQGHKPENSPDQLLALAITGWLLGKEAAEAKPETAERLWQMRQGVLDYERATDALTRHQLLQRFQAKTASAAPIDELTQLIPSLPPPYADSAPAGGKLELRTNLPSPLGRSGIRYVVQLPPEYHPSRLYPVLFALHGEGRRPERMLERLSEAGAEYGYILVAPEWAQPMEDEYHYTAEEQAAVLDVLKDVRRRFQVDSDRVFVTGFGQGANMAFDVGLSHPDQFAGVLPVAGGMYRFSASYWHNAQYLPLYVLDGELDGDNPRRNKPVLEKWMPRGYPALYVEYRGRGLEWFEYELPTMFDWMDHKRNQYRRASAVPQLGRNGNGGPLGEEFQTMRQGDNHFYWLSSDAITKAHLNDISDWDVRKVPATFQGQIGEGNLINVNVRGMKEVTVWLTRDMIDFNKPVTIRINGVPRLFNRRVASSPETLLETLYQTGDRQRLYWAKLTFDRP